VGAISVTTRDGFHTKNEYPRSGQWVIRLSEGRIMAYPRAGYGTKNVSFQKNNFIIFQE